MIEVIFFGFGSAHGVGPEPTRETSARRLKSTSRAFCEALEKGAVVADEPRQAMGFAIPRVED